MGSEEVDSYLKEIKKNCGQRTRLTVPTDTFFFRLNFCKQKFDTFPNLYFYIREL